MAVGRITNESELQRFIEQFIPPSLGQQIQTLMGGASRRGSGDPNGVEDGEIGAEFIDEAGAPGAIVYRKTTALGTLTGWTAIA